MSTLSKSYQRCKNRLKGRKLVFTVLELRRAVMACLSNSEKKWSEQRVVSVSSVGPERGRALFSYRIGGFLVSPDDPLVQIHTHFWQSVQMVRTLTELGYTVDVIDYNNTSFQPEREYALFIDVRHNMERLAARLGKDCLKVFHIDSAHLLAHNSAEALRLLALLERRGVTLPPQRHEPPNCGIDHADYATGNAGEFSLSTFRHAGKPIYPLPAPAAHTFDWPQDKDWAGCRNRFVWFGSSGLVHKGLDLVLEAFAGMPDCHLTVCAPVDQEGKFKQAYHRELYQTHNIETAGWVEIGSTKFREICLACAAVVYPSCSEGLSTSTVECMHAGLLPIVSYETGVPVEDFGFEITPCTVAQIQELARVVTRMPVEELKERSRQAWQFARANHTQAEFAKAYRAAMTDILARHEGGAGRRNS
jgi:glycosyltransferase involved in cell wall biosynthesis